MEDYIDVIYPKGEAIKKYEASHPYNFFLTAIVDSPPTHQETLSITMQELLDTSLGDLESSVQINFMVDIGWLLAHYYFAGHLYVSSLPISLSSHGLLYPPSSSLPDQSPF